MKQHRLKATLAAIKTPRLVLGVINQSIQAVEITLGLGDKRTDLKARGVCPMCWRALPRLAAANSQPMRKLKRPSAASSNEAALYAARARKHC
jgi:hypothetical protein